MASMPNTVDIVSAAATAIVTAENRIQPSSVQKRRWGSCLNLYWCFGSYKHSKRIGHAVLIPQQTISAPTVPRSETLNHSISIVLPFLAPPSSPAPFLQSDPPSATRSPAKLLSLTSLSVNACSPGGMASIFATGPYAHETQLVTPPVFSAGTTEPSTAAYTPPPESVQPTAPSSPEVPFAQLLASSLARNRRNSKTNLRFSLSNYEFQPYQYPGSPGGHLISPGSVLSNSGTTSPYLDKQSIYQFHISEAAKLLGYDNHTVHKWGSRLGSGSLTPNGRGSLVGSGTLTPNGGTPLSQEIYLSESQISEVASLANSDRACQNQEVVIDHRVSFELVNEEVQSVFRKELAVSHRTTSESLAETPAGGVTDDDVTRKDSEHSCQCSVDESTDGNPGEVINMEPERSFHKRTITLGSSKDFNFENTEGEVLDKSIVECEWWKTEKFAENVVDNDKDWTFFPMLQPGLS